MKFNGKVISLDKMKDVTNHPSLGEGKGVGL